MPILTVGEKFPEFELTALKGGDLHDVNANQPEDYFEQVSLDKYQGMWKVVFFYPKDFTFCLLYTSDAADDIALV